MGKRGPNAVPMPKAPKPKQGAAQPKPTPRPWDAPGLSRAARVIAFAESLPVTSGTLAGTQFKFRPWQRRWIEKVYRTDAEGRRVVRTAVNSMARKNGKTDMAARLCLAHLAGPEAEERGECYSAANDRLQAGKIFNEMVAIIRRVDWLVQRVSIRSHSKELEDIGPGGTGSIYAALSSDVGTKHGLSPSFFCYDELGQSPDRKLYDVLDTAMGARAEPLGVVISTQAARDDAPMSELVDYGLRVQRGEIDDPSFDLELHTAPLEADPWDPATWLLANPALGDFRSLEDVQRMAKQAERLPSREASFRNLILNQRVSTSAHFLTPAVWAGCTGAVDRERLKGRPCFAALDLGGTRDLTALVLVFEDDDGGLDVAPHFWLAGDLREHEDTDRAPYVVWEQQGHILSGGAKTLDPKIVATKIAELHGAYDIRALAYDRWRIEDLRRELDALGCAVELVPHGQGFKDMAPAVSEFERLAHEGKLRTGDHPVLTWNVSNVKTTSDPAGNRKFDKQKSTGRIDGAQALAMCCGLRLRQEAPAEFGVFFVDVAA
ncbi:MAG: terminase large subunit [Alphaproteobacteria bacterium]|nr:terminase large subunit [Alphaproteobacteria bacterium]